MYKGNGITLLDLDLTRVETGGGPGPAKYSCLFFVYLSFKALFCILKHKVKERTTKACPVGEESAGFAGQGQPWAVQYSE